MWNKNRKTITGMEFTLEPNPVEVSDLIEQLNDMASKERKKYNHEFFEQVNYQCDFEEINDSIIFEGSKSVLLEREIEGIEKQKVKICNLRPGDKVRIYSNISKEKLFEIAVAEDREGRFKKIYEDSQLWKRCLSDFFNNACISNLFFNETEFLKNLQSNGLTISNPLTLRKWINSDDKEKFPNALSNLIAIKETIQCPELNLNFETIKNSRRLYRSIMIALGRDLSDEVTEYFISDGKQKGKLLERFSDSFITQAAPLKTIKNIKITEEDETDGN